MAPFLSRVASRTSQSYSLVARGDTEGDGQSPRSRSRSRSPLPSSLARSAAWKVVLRIVLLLSIVAASFYTGRYSTPKDLNDPVNLSIYPQTFTLNPHGGAPSNTTDPLWATILPPNGGFFVNHALAPRQSTFSVFHQIHCLDQIRHAYWKSYSATIAGVHLRKDDFIHMQQTEHVKHCIDLIRQELMCRPDLTIETVDDMGGVTGYGGLHRCNDWGELVEWVNDWEGVLGEDGPIEMHTHSGHGR